MDLKDVFPTTLVCNTRARLLDLTGGHGLALGRYTEHRGLSGYGGRSDRVRRAFDTMESGLPRSMWQTMVFEAHKPARWANSGRTTRIPSAASPGLVLST